PRRPLPNIIQSVCTRPGTIAPVLRSSLVQQRSERSLPKKMARKPASCAAKLSSQICFPVLTSRARTVFQTVRKLEKPPCLGRASLLFLDDLGLVHAFFDCIHDFLTVGFVLVSFVGCGNDLTVRSLETPAIILAFVLVDLELVLVVFQSLLDAFN